MSRITNCILSFHSYEFDEIPILIEKVNSFFDRESFVSCDMATPLYIALLHNFRKEDFLNHLLQMNWKYPKHVQLILQGPDDNRFEIINLEEYLTLDQYLNLYDSRTPELTKEELLCQLENTGTPLKSLNN